MLSIGLTGGIAAGKSLLSDRFRELGAVVIDADRLARDVVGVGTPGLAEVLAAFGPELALPDGGLDRPALGALVFGDPERLAVLNAIVHPRVRAAAAALERDAGAEAIVVQDIPLLVESGQQDRFHLVLVVHAPRQERLRRLVTERGMSVAAAQARMAAQASDAQRAVAADLLLPNDGDRAATLLALDRLWRERLLPFNAALLRGRAAATPGPAVVGPPDPRWPEQAARLAQRLLRACGDAAVGVDHIGSTAVPGLPAKDVLDLQLRVPSLADVDALAPALAAAGFPLADGDWRDTPHAFGAGAAGPWLKRFGNACDPGRPVNLHVRADGSPGAHFALAMRDWLRAEAGPREAYARFKQDTARQHSNDADTAGYAAAKEPWIAAAVPELRRWRDAQPGA